MLVNAAETVKRRCLVNTQCPQSGPCPVRRRSLGFEVEFHFVITRSDDDLRGRNDEHKRLTNAVWRLTWHTPSQTGQNAGSVHLLLS